MTRPLIEDQWRKSSYSNGAGGECVEVASTGSTDVVIRDSKNVDGPRLVFGPASWAGFVGTLRQQGLGRRTGA
ncbi:DUF397 domain-containing protein [Streptomyces sp. NPDC088124]|uniref:DUF397 domain-containing protein n=1 Tax=Streptomyces sp. NPDC088124 TaxID=3154654 RepID=UPI00343B3AB1